MSEDKMTTNIALNAQLMNLEGVLRDFLNNVDSEISAYGLQLLLAVQKTIDAYRFAPKTFVELPSELGNKELAKTVAALENWLTNHDPDYLYTALEQLILTRLARNVITAYKEGN